PSPAAADPTKPFSPSATPAGARGSSKARLRPTAGCIVRPISTCCSTATSSRSTSARSPRSASIRRTSSATPATPDFGRAPAAIPSQLSDGLSGPLRGAEPSSLGGGTSGLPASRARLSATAGGSLEKSGGGGPLVAPGPLVPDVAGLCTGAGGGCTGPALRGAWPGSGGGAGDCGGGAGRGRPDRGDMACGGSGGGPLRGRGGVPPLVAGHDDGGGTGCTGADDGRCGAGALAA